jgi:hypothetical protein
MRNIEFALVKIQTKQFAVNPEVYKPKLRIQFSYGLNFNFINDQRLVLCSLKSMFLQKDIPFLQLEVNCSFQLSHQAWKDLSNDEGAGINIPKGFAQHLGVITVGTCRGVLHSKTENTGFNKFVLPTIDIKDLIKEDITYTLKENK